MSRKYEILKKLVRASGMKKSMMKSKDEIVAIQKKKNTKNVIPEIKDKEIECARMYINGFPVLRLTHTPKSERANLFIIGGGMVKPPRPASIRKAVKIAKLTGLDLYVPYYPLCTDYPVSKAFEMILATYETMLKEYKAENISALGTSSGGCLALGMIAYMNDIGSEVERPNHIIAISPGTCPVTKEEKARMRELDEKDVIIPAEYMITAEEIMKHGENVPDYMLHLQNGDFTDCPHVTFFYGSDEVLYAIAPSFEEAMKKYNVDYEMIVGEGMFHVYPVFPIVKEAKEGWDQMIDLMKKKI